LIAGILTTNGRVTYSRFSGWSPVSTFTSSATGSLECGRLGVLRRAGIVRLIASAHSVVFAWQDGRVS
jgi:hypothetical protein